MESNKVGLIAIKAEATYGTDAVPTKAANLIPIAQGSLAWRVLSEPVEREPLDGKMIPLIGYNALPSVQVEFDYELRGNRTNGVVADISAGAAAQKVEIDPILQAANMTPTYFVETGVGNRDGYVVYPITLFTTVGPSVDVYWWSQAKLHKLLGGKVNLTFTWQAGKMVIMHVTIRGKYVAVTDVAFSTTGAVWLDTKPPIYEGGVGTLTAGGACVFSQCVVNLNNQIVQRADPNDATGIAGFAIASVKPSGTIDPESNAEATHPLWADWRASTIKGIALDTPIAAGASGNRIELLLTAELKDVNYADKENLRIHQVAFNIVRTNLSAADTAPLALKFY